MTPPTDDASARQRSGGPSPGLARRGHANNGSGSADSAEVVIDASVGAATRMTDRGVQTAPRWIAKLPSWLIDRRMNCALPGANFIAPNRRKGSVAI